MKIGVFGAGGVGGYFGGRLAEAGADVHLLARGDHLRALQEDGLRVRSVHGDFAVDLPATDDPEDIGSCDVVLFCVKSFDTEGASDRLTPLIGADTAVISLQNGVINEETLASKVGEEHTLGGVAYIFSTIKEAGVIAHTGGPARITFGELDGHRSERGLAFEAQCDRAEGMEGSLSEDIWRDLWEKYAFICAQAGVTAAIRLPIGAIRAVDESWRLFESILSEVAAVAAAEGSGVRESAIEEWLEFALNLEPNAYSSLHYDMTNDKRMELDALHGTVVDKARANGVEVPRTETIYAILRPWAEKNARQ